MSPDAARNRRTSRLLSRRALLGSALLGSAALTAGASTLILFRKTSMRLVTFGDSILDCGRYNEYGVDPGHLLVRNDDRLFPSSAARLSSPVAGPIWSIGHGMERPSAACRRR